MRPTIKDVARRAGVSVATVSFVLNEHSGHPISDKVKRKVQTAAHQLNYHPRASARGLAAKRTHNITLLFYQRRYAVSNQFRSWIIEGAIEEAIKRQYNVQFSYLEQYDGERSLPKVVLEHNTDGVVVFDEVSPELARALGRREIPLVAIDADPSLEGVNGIRFDAYQGGALAAEHLVQLGHTALAFLGSTSAPSVAMRQRGFIDGLARHGLTPKLLPAGALTFDAALDAARSAFQTEREITGFFCSNDEAAAATLRAAFDVGLRAPEDLSVVGFDDIAMAGFTSPPLTTVNVDKGQLGVRAVARLVEIIDGKDPTIRSEVWPVTLVVRQSSGPPPRRRAALTGRARRK